MFWSTWRSEPCLVARNHRAVRPKPLNGALLADWTNFGLKLAAFWTGRRSRAVQLPPAMATGLVVPEQSGDIVWAALKKQEGAPCARSGHSFTMMAASREVCIAHGYELLRHIGFATALPRLCAGVPVRRLRLRWHARHILRRLFCAQVCRGDELGKGSGTRTGPQRAMGSHLCCDRRDQTLVLRRTFPGVPSVRHPFFFRSKTFRRELCSLFFAQAMKWAHRLAGAVPS